VNLRLRAYENLDLCSYAKERFETARTLNFCILNESSATRQVSSLRVQSTRRFYANSVVHGRVNSLLTAAVALRRSDRDVAGQTLDLLQFSSGRVTQACAVAAEIVRRERQNAGSGRRILDPSKRPFGVTELL
jgi:hypothetical protein